MKKTLTFILILFSCLSYSQVTKTVMYNGKIVSFGSVVIYDDGAVDYFIYELDVLIETITIPAGNTTAYMSEVSYDGGATWLEVTSFNDADLTHSYSVAGSYVVIIRGVFPYFRCNNGAYAQKITKLTQWGNVGVDYFVGMFYGADNCASTMPPIPSYFTELGANFARHAGFTGTLILHDGITDIGAAAFFETPGFTRVESYSTTAPTVGTDAFLFGGTARPLHIPVSNSGYNIAPWTTTSIFSTIINDL